MGGFTATGWCEPLERLIRQYIIFSIKQAVAVVQFQMYDGGQVGENGNHIF